MHALIQVGNVLDSKIKAEKAQIAKNSQQLKMLDMEVAEIRKNAAAKENAMKIKLKKGSY